MAAESAITIPLREGVVAIVDAADAALVGGHKWRLLRRTGGHVGYAVTWINGRTVKLHSLLMNGEPGQVVDHINGDGLDNRRANLRLCTRTQNLWNQRPVNGRRFKGVSPLPNGKFRLLLSCTFNTEEEAARAYDRLAQELYGEFARLNFPEKTNGC